MVLIAFAILFGGLGAFSLSTPADSDATTAASSSAETVSQVPTTAKAGSPTLPPKSSSAAASATAAPPTTTASTRPAAAVDHAIPVRVLNNSLVAGLAANTATKLRTAGWTNVTSGNYAAGTIRTTTVYFGDNPREQAAAEAIASELGAHAVPRFAGIATAAPGVIVIIASG
ncbi:MAG: LytR C-terminal domain-containing protein [Mycobacteriaceae bacterium]|nr:LytR C-terminal domain-containing protein [Mycobacteriaceae bacterium]